MRTRRSPRNQERLWKALGQEGQPEEPRTPVAGRTAAEIDAMWWIGKTSRNLMKRDLIGDKYKAAKAVALSPPKVGEYRQGRDPDYDLGWECSGCGTKDIPDEMKDCPNCEAHGCEWCGASTRRPQAPDEDDRICADCAAKPKTEARAFRVGYNAHRYSDASDPARYTHKRIVADTPEDALNAAYIWRDELNAGDDAPKKTGRGVGHYVGLIHHNDIIPVGEAVEGFKPRFVPEHLLPELSNLWHLSKVPTSGVTQSRRYHRMLWTAKAFQDAHPDVKGVYKDLDSFVSWNEGMGEGYGHGSPVNMRIASKFVDGGGAQDGGGWIVQPHEWPKSAKADHIRKTVADFQREEPAAGWHLQARGTERGWHKVEEETMNESHAHRGTFDPNCADCMATHIRTKCVSCPTTLYIRRDSPDHDPLTGTNGAMCNNCATLERPRRAESAESDETFGCSTCCDGTVVNNTCDACGERHCPDCDPCEEVGESAALAGAEAVFETKYDGNGVAVPGTSWGHLAHHPPSPAHLPQHVQAVCDKPLCGKRAIWKDVEKYRCNDHLIESVLSEFGTDRDPMHGGRQAAREAGAPSVGTVPCDKCDGPNDRAAESNYCSKCATEYQARVRRERDRLGTGGYRGPRESVLSESPEWSDCECHDPDESNHGWSSSHGGYTMDVHEAEHPHSFSPKPGFFWRVDATSQRSEWPEVHGAGFERSAASAKAAAAQSAHDAELRWNGKPDLDLGGVREAKEIAVGDTVKYSAKFLRSTGMYTGDIPFAKGRVKAITVHSPAHAPGTGWSLADVEWDTDSAPGRVNVKNLIRHGDLEPD